MYDRLHRKKTELVLRSGCVATAVEKMLSAIEERLSSPRNRMLYCLGIHQVGRTACKDLARRYRSYETLIEAIDDLITTRSNLLNGVTSPKEVKKVDRKSTRLNSSH